MPSRWIREGELAAISWRESKGDATAALLLLMALCVERNRANIGRETGERASAAVPASDDRELVHATYDRLMDMTMLSRAKVAGGLKILRELKVVVATPRASEYRLPSIETPGSWCQLPQGHVWDNPHVAKYLKGLTLRHRAELDALKVYLMLLAFRGNKNSVTLLGYERMTQLAGLDRTEITRAKSHLFNWGLIVEKEVDPAPGQIGRNPTSYKIRGFSVDPPVVLA